MRKGDDRMSSWRRLALTVTGFALWTGVCAFHELPQNQTWDPTRVHATFRNNGKFVHNVGRLQLQVTNFGETGNQDNPRFTTVPSAEWPACSGNDYLFAAGLWIGAIDASGIPHVTTATYERAFSPDIAPTNVCVNLPIDQVADDHDGLCDEDYVAIGQQMFASEYNYYQATTRPIFPEHVPLGIKVQQTSYAWATPGQNDYVGMDYKIINNSGRALRNVYVAIFADMDIGNRAIRGYFTDDEAGLIDTTVQYLGPTGEFVHRRIQMGYMWDNPDDPARIQDAKGGDVPGYFGCMFLNHTTDPSGVTAPKHVGITAFKFFSGSASFAAGGDPENDAQRYILLSDPNLNPDVTGQIISQRPLDYRFIMATGPFRSILPDSSLTVSVAWVMGLGRGPSQAGGTMIDNAISAQQVFDGLYTDLDGNALTGTCGKETCLLNAEAGTGGRGFTYTIPESSLCRLRFHTDVQSVFGDVTPWDPITPCDLQQDGKYVCQDVLGGTLKN